VKLVAGLLAALALAGGVSRGDHPTVLAASSLTQVFPRIDPGAAYSFAGSDQLAYQIEQGAPADVFAAASPKYPARLYREGLVRRPQIFATNRLILLLPASNPAGIRSVFDLRRRGIKLVIGQSGVPIGDYTRTVLRRLRLTSALDDVVSEEADVEGIVGKVVLGQADAGFVYATDARPVAGKVRVVELPARGQPVVRYELAVLVGAHHPAVARAFVARVLGAGGRARLAAAGFGLP
jgi:molybdate transport system substrate-binding protein